MSDFEKLIYASDLIGWIMEAYPDWCVGDVRSIVDHVEDMPSAQPEPCVDTIDALNESIKHFDDMAEECRRNANIERNDYMDMRDDAAEYRQLSTWLNELRWLRERFQSQPKRKKGKWKRNITAERDAQLIFTKVYNCSECGYESVGNNLKNFCPNCGCDMRGDEE